MRVFGQCKKCGRDRKIFTSMLCKECHVEMGLPTPEQIRAECAKIRAEWTDKRVSHANRGDFPQVLVRDYMPRVFRTPSCSHGDQ